MPLRLSFSASSCRDIVRRMRSLAAGVLVVTLCAAGLFADEGMWTFENVPRADITKKYGVRLTDDWLHRLEDRHGRRRDVPRFSSRTLDVDIVLFDDLVMDGPGHLQLPRKELAEAFVLKPLADIAPDLRHPVNGETLGALWAAAAPPVVFAPVDLNSVPA